MKIDSESEMVNEFIKRIKQDGDICGWKLLPGEIEAIQHILSHKKYGDKDDIYPIPELKLKPNLLHNEAILEFTTRSHRHFRLALCERDLWGNQTQRKYLYLSNDMETYTTMMDFDGVGVPDMFHSMKVEGFSFVLWIPTHS